MTFFLFLLSFLCLITILVQCCMTSHAMPSGTNAAVPILRRGWEGCRLRGSLKLKRVCGAVCASNCHLLLSKSTGSLCLPLHTHTQAHTHAQTKMSPEQNYSLAWCCYSICSDMFYWSLAQNKMTRGQEAHKANTDRTHTPWRHTRTHKHRLKQLSAVVQTCRCAQSDV